MNFERLSVFLDGLAESHRLPAYDCTVRLGRETVFQKRAGCREDGLYWYYSATKLFTATAACRLLERGVIGLDDPVSVYLPEYADLTVREKDGTLRPAKTELTVRHLFTMTGGLSYDIFHEAIVRAEDRSTRGIAARIATMPLLADPGEMFIYSLCHDVLAAVVEAASGVRFAAYIHNEIAAPLGMTDMTFHPDAAQMARLEPQYRYKGKHHPPERTVDACHYCFSDAYDSGGAGLCGTARDYILLPEALANGGLGANGYAVLRPETVELMRTNQLPSRVLATFHMGWNRLRAYGYGLGVRTRMDRRDGGKSPAGEFGWDGAAGAFCIADPENDLSALYVQHVLEMGPVYEEIHPVLRDLIYACLEA